MDLSDALLTYRLGNLHLADGAFAAAAESLLTVEGAAPPLAPEPLSDAALRAHLRRLGPEDFGRFEP